MKGQSEPRIVAAALGLTCPRCQARPGVRCSVESRGVRRHIRTHKERLDAGHKVVRDENTARLREQFGRIGDAV